MYVLILTYMILSFTSSGGPAIASVTQEFSSEQNCFVAGRLMAQDIQKKFDSANPPSFYNPKVSFACVRK